MGLDMYLNGEKFFMSSVRQKEDGFDVAQHELQLGYWRKHPNLHGYIVQEFAEGLDECQRIELNEVGLLKIIAAITDGQLPHTTGFFFGESDGSEKDEDLKIMQAALDWLRKPEPNVWKSVVYQASW